jgi:pilus assembly protein CpaF
MSLEKQLVGSSAALLSWMKDEEITDILINGPRSLFFEKQGILKKENSPFSDEASLMDLVERIVIPTGRRIDVTQPYLDGKMADGSRFHIILPPLAASGPYISIRKKRAIEKVSFYDFGDKKLLDYLLDKVVSKKNILIAGSTGAGKTTLLSRFLDRLPCSDRIATIEEVLEIETTHPHTVRLETRLPSADGIGEVSLRTLIRNALRMRPNRIVLGECRGEEAFDLLQALNTGHGGSLCTLHANSARDALRRLEGLVLLSGVRAPLESIREWVSTALDFVIQMRQEGGARQIVEVLELLGMEGPVYRFSPVWPPQENIARAHKL